jgi:AcrR family transcriptional regulator
MSKHEPATGKAATQERILVAANELFIARGYERTTVANIAARAGVGRATVFWHFGDKGALFKEAFARLLRPFRESLARDFGAVDPVKRLEEQLASSERFAREHSAEIGAFVRWALESPDFRETVITTALELNQRFADALTETVREIVPPDRDPKLLAHGLMLAFDANLLLSMFDDSRAGIEQRSAAVQALAAMLPGKRP